MTFHLLEMPHGRPSNTPTLIKHALRFARRLRRRDIYPFEFPAMVDDGRSVCKVKVGKRVVNIFDDGTCTRSLMLPSSNLRPRGGFDHAAFIAQSNRMHALYLGMAAHARGLGLKAAARADLTTAIQERLHHERAD